MDWNSRSGGGEGGEGGGGGGGVVRSVKWGTEDADAHRRGRRWD